MEHFIKELDQAFQLCSQSNTNDIKNGEYILQRLKSNLDYPRLLLEYIKKNQPSYQGKLRASIELRLWCDYYKGLEQFEQKQYSHAIEDVKAYIVLAYLSLENKISKTLLLGIVSLTVVEFPDNWQQLISGLIMYSEDNPGSTLRVLELLVQITNKYSYMSRSDPLFKEIIIFCQQAHNYVLKLTRISLNTVLNNQNNHENVRILQCLMTLFYNMNYQDLPPQFQDNLSEWMEILKRVMQFPNSNQGIFKCKGAALQSILLYASKYKEDVQESIKGFSQQIWALCANAQPDSQYDDVVFNSLKYFRSLILWQDMKQFFSNNISNLISNLVIPNITITKEVMYSLDDETESWIDHYFRNGDMGSRRAAALDLLKTITRNYPVFEIFIKEQISSFDTSSNNISGQCLLLTLITESAPKAFRDVNGATQLYFDPTIIDYCYNNLIKKTLNTMYNISNSNSLIENQMDRVQLIVNLRFIFYFRVFLPTNQLPLILKLCCMTKTNQGPLKQVLLLMISSLVSVRHGEFMLLKSPKQFFDENNFREVAKQVFNVIGSYDSQSRELSISLTNLFYISIQHLKSSCSQFYDYSISPIINSMLGKLQVYDFQTVLRLFEGISHLTYYLCLSKSPKCADLENIIHQLFMRMIEKESDILNFCFQILSIFLQINPGNIKYYENVYRSILSIENWREDNLSIMASYTQYICAYITSNNKNILQDKTIFQNILSKLIELDYFDLFYRFLAKILKITNIEGFVNSGYMDIAIKGTGFIFNKSLAGRKAGLLFLFELTFNYNAQYVINSINSAIPLFFQKAVIENEDIIKTIQIYRYRKTMFGALCNALVSGCFQNSITYAIVLNLLIENLLGRTRNFAISEKQDKQTAYKKLLIFKEIDQQDQPINLEEEVVLLQSYTICLERDGSLNNQISQPNQSRMRRLFQRQKSR